MTRILSVFNLLKRAGFAVLLLGGANLQAQSPDLRWTHEYGIDTSRIEGLVVLPDNGVIAYGGIRRDHCTSYCDGLLMKVDDEGTQEWRNIYSFPNGRRLDFFNRCVLTSDQLLVCVGRGHESSTSLSAFVARINSEGDTLWISYFGFSPFDEANDVLVLDDAIYVSGSAYNQETATEDWPIIAKFNFDGDLLWQHFFTGSSTNNVVLLAHNDNSGLFALDCKTVGPGLAVPIVFSVNEQGEFGVADTIHLRADSRITILQFASYEEQGFVMSGESTHQFSTTSLVARLNNSMDTVWTRSFEDSWAGRIARYLDVRNDGTILTGLDYGVFYPDQGIVSYSAQFIRISQTGDTVWTKLIGLTPDDDYNSGPIVPVSDGSYYFVSNFGNIATHFSLSRSFPDTLQTEANGPGSNIFSSEFTFDSAFPNPFNGSISISIVVPTSTILSIKAFDLLGRIVFSKPPIFVIKGQHYFNIDMSNVATGAYLLVARSRESSVAQKVFLIR